MMTRWNFKNEWPHGVANTPLRELEPRKMLLTRVSRIETYVGDMSMIPPFISTVLERAVVYDRYGFPRRDGGINTHA